MAEGDGFGTVEEGQVATASKATERLTFFSDAVVAIAITLLAIELPVPTGATTAEFLAVVHEETFEYVSFLISFVVIAAHWRIHHSLFRHVRRCDGLGIHLNMLWLLLIVLTPFFTRVLNGANDDQLTFLRFTLYATAQALQLVTMAALIALIARRRWFAETAPVQLTKRGWVRSLIPAVSFVLSVPAFPLIGGWAFVLWFVLPLALDRISERAGIVARA